MNINSEEAARTILERIDRLEPVRECRELAGEIAMGVEAAGSVSEEVAERVKRDWLACGLVTRALIAYPEEKVGEKPLRITGAVGYSDGSTYPDPALLTQEDLDYLAGRATVTRNFVLKARYFHLAYALAVKAPREFAQAAIDAYLESARLFADSNRRHPDMDAVAEIDQAVALALQIQDKDRLNSIVNYVVEKFQAEPEDRQGLDGKRLPVGRSLYDLSNILLYIANHKKMGGVVSTDILVLIEETMNALAQHNAAAGMHFLNYQLLSASQKAATLRNDTARSYEFTINRIESLVKQAQTPADKTNVSSLVNAKYYEDAITQYESLRDAAGAADEQKVAIDTRINELRLLLKAAYRQARDSNAYSTIPVEFEIEILERDAILDELLSNGSLITCLDRIVGEGFLLPNVTSAMEEAKQSLIDAPLQAMISRTHIADDLPVAHANTDYERLNAAKDQNILLWIQINSAAILIPLFDRLQSEKELNAETLSAYFERWGLASEQVIEFLGIGFRHYFANDFASALHVLIPRYEALLRGAFELGGTASFRSRRTQAGSEAETLGAFLRRPTVSNALPEDLREYIRLVLAEPSGWNLRNRIAHGLIRLQECTALEAAVVLHLFLLLTVIKIVPTTKGVLQQ